MLEAPISIFRQCTDARAATCWSLLLPCAICANIDWLMLLIMHERASSRMKGRFRFCLRIEFLASLGFTWICVSARKAQLVSAKPWAWESAANEIKSGSQSHSSSFIAVLSSFFSRRKQRVKGFFLFRKEISSDFLHSQASFGELCPNEKCDTRKVPTQTVSAHNYAILSLVGVVTMTFLRMCD